MENTEQSGQICLFSGTFIVLKTKQKYYISILKVIHAAHAGWGLFNFMLSIQCMSDIQNPGYSISQDYRNLLVHVASPSHSPPRHSLKIALELTMVFHMA